MTASLRSDIAATLATLTGLEPVGGDGPTTVWRGRTLGIAPYVMGAQIIAQALAAGARRDPDQPVRSIHLAFVKPVADTGTIDYTVTVLHSGRQYATQRIDVIRPGRDGTPEVAITATVVAHSEAPGVEHGARFPAHAGTPDTSRPIEMGFVPGEFRVAGATDLDARGVQPNEYLLWGRCRGPLPDDPAAHQALLAFPSELPLIGTALLQHGDWSQLDAHVALRTAVLTHQIVFHRPFRCDDWLLFAANSPAAAGGSSYGRSDVFTASGTHVASVSQEAMIRVADK